MFLFKNCTMKHTRRRSEMVTFSPCRRPSTMSTAGLPDGPLTVRSVPQSCGSSHAMLPSLPRMPSFACPASHALRRGATSGKRHPLNLIPTCVLSRIRPRPVRPVVADHRPAHRPAHRPVTRATIRPYKFWSMGAGSVSFTLVVCVQEV